ncbi:MAG: hypothetical protein K5656_01565 [Lachnospiraceae bacterium]|nr:hypothetical protein [Lachnospiraceae bacterium]
MKRDKLNIIKKPLTLFVMVVVFTALAVFAAYEYGDRYIPAYADETTEQSEASSDAQSAQNLLETSTGSCVIWEWKRVTWENYLEYIEEHQNKFFSSMFLSSKHNIYNTTNGDTIEYPDFISTYSDKNHISRGSNNSVNVMTANATYKYSETNWEFDIIGDIDGFSTTTAPFKDVRSEYDQYRNMYIKMDADSQKELDASDANRDRFYTKGGTLGTIFTQPLRTIDTDMTSDKAGYFPLFTVNTPVNVALSKPSFSTESQKNNPSLDLSYKQIYNTAKYDNNGHYDPSYYYLRMPIYTDEDDSEDYEPALALTHKGIHEYKGFLKDDMEARAIAASQIRIAPSYATYFSTGGYSVLGSGGIMGLMYLSWLAHNNDYETMEKVASATMDLNKKESRELMSMLKKMSDQPSISVLDDPQQQMFSLISEPGLFKGNGFNESYINLLNGYICPNREVFRQATYHWFVGEPHVFSTIKGEGGAEGTGEGGVTTVGSGYLMPVGTVSTLDKDNAEVRIDGIILPEHSKIVLEKGAVLSVDGNLINNGKIINNGGTILVKDGGCISSFTDTNEGFIECHDGGQIIVMEKGRISCTVNKEIFENYSTNTYLSGLRDAGQLFPSGLTMTTGSSLINYGKVYISNTYFDESAVVDNRKDGYVKFGCMKKDNDVMIAWLTDSEMEELHSDYSLEETLEKMRLELAKWAYRSYSKEVDTVPLEGYGEYSDDIYNMVYELKADYNKYFGDGVGNEYYDSIYPPIAGHWGVYDGGWLPDTIFSSPDNFLYQGFGTNLSVICERNAKVSINKETRTGNAIEAAAIKINGKNFVNKNNSYQIDSRHIVYSVPKY